MKRILTLIVCAIALCGDMTICGQTTFTGANSNEFNDPGNWDNGLPNDNNAGIIPSGLVVVNNGVLDNDFNYFSSIAIYGTFVNNGSILPSTGDLYNHGAVVNKGHLTCFNHNYGSLINYSEAYVEAENFDFNSGFILNQGVMSIGFGEDGNQGIIENQGTFYIGGQNSGEIYNSGLLVISDWLDNLGLLVNDGTIHGGAGIQDTLINNGSFFHCYPELGECDCAQNVLDPCGVCGGEGVGGCTDLYACNYNPDASCDDGSCYLCEIPSSHCGEGTTWDVPSQTCIPANVSDTDFDGCVGINDFLVHLSNFGSGCGPVPAWACGDPLEYQGYDYETVQIGEQCWFAENLRANNFLSGDIIPSSLEAEEWLEAYGWYGGAEEGAVALYGEGSSACSSAVTNGNACDSAWSLEEFGRLYNGFAVADVRGLCPNGWHISSEEDWNVMTSLFGGHELKGQVGWSTENGGSGNDASGFSGKAGGMRRGSEGEDYFESAGYNGFWWTPSNSSVEEGYAPFRSLDHHTDGVYAGIELKGWGFSIRCVKDTE